VSINTGTNELLFDNSRISMRDYNGVLYCEAYMADEFRVGDVQSMIEVIKSHYSGNCDIILKKVGNYSVSVEAQIFLSKGVREFGSFIYVVDSEIKRESAEYASQTYMKSYNAAIATSIEQAYQKLQQRNAR
jgi:hypothetical protein